MVEHIAIVRKDNGKWMLLVTEPGKEPQVVDNDIDVQALPSRADAVGRFVTMLLKSTRNR